MASLKRLKLKAIDLISLVDRGDNPEAHVVIHKRAEGENDCSTDKGGTKMPHMNPEDKSENVALWKKVGVALKLLDKDDVIPDEEVVVDKDAQEKKIQALNEEVEKLKKDKATADAVSAAVDDISKAKSPEEVDAVLAKLEEVDVIKAVTDRAKDRKVELDKSAGEAEVQKFRDSLPEALRSGFDEMDEKDQTQFMKSYSDPGDDPVAKALEAVTKANELLVAKVEKLEDGEELRKAEAELKDLDGVVESVPELAKTVVKLRKHDPDAATSMIEGYRALAKQAKDSGLFDILGKEKGAGGDAEEKIEKAVKAHMEANPEDTPEVAMTKVLEANPELYTEHLEEQE